MNKQQEALQRLTDVSLEIEAALAEPDRHALQAEGKHPAPCARHCEAKAYEIEIRMLKAALKQEQEPVAWMTHSNDLLPLFHRTERAALMWGAEPTPLYTAPPQRESSSLEAMTRKPLSEEEIEQAYRYIYRNVPADFDHTSMGWIEHGIRYAEQAHGIKGEA